MRPLYGYWGVFFLRGVGNEVVLCVSTLMLVARGLSLSEIAFILMLGFAATTILEIPSGMAGDLWGRKRLWVLSVLCSLVWLFACLTGWKPLIALGALVNGVGVALGSGTMDALYVERWMEHFGKEHLARAGMWSTLCTYAGFAAGALLSGSLPVAWMQTVPYTLHLTVSLLLFAVMLAAGIGVVHETAASSKTTSWKASLQEMYTQLKQTGRLTADQPILLLVLSAAVIMGFSTVGVELYWQPRLEVLSQPEQLSWMLSICSFFSMAMLAVSGIGAAAVLERVRTTTGKVAVYAAYRFTMIGMMACMAFIGQAPLFILLYVLYYTAMGGQDTVDAVLLHEAVPNSQRGTVMSVQSLALRFGGMISQALCGVLLLKIELMQVWLLLAVIHAIGFMLCLWIFGKRRKAKADKNVKKMGEKAENLTCP